MPEAKIVKRIGPTMKDLPSPNAKRRRFKKTVILFALFLPVIVVLAYYTARRLTK